MSCYIKELQAEIKDLKNFIREVRLSFICIGAPLNDNILKFNNKQLTWLLNIEQNIKYKLSEEGNK